MIWEIFWVFLRGLPREPWLRRERGRATRRFGLWEQQRDRRGNRVYLWKGTLGLKCDRYYSRCRRVSSSLVYMFETLLLEQDPEMTSIWVVPVKDDISAFKIKSKLVVNFLILSLSLMKGYYCDVFFFFYMYIKYII